MKRAPVLFVGHGSPMNAVEDNAFSREWSALGARLERPEAILSVSAHWFTPGTRVSTAETNRTIHDFYGFPEALYRVEYAAPAAPGLARRAAERIARPVTPDAGWGLDHGSWSVLRRLFPKADVPVFQLSVDRNAAPEEHFQMGRELAGLRDEGVMIFASGNVVHNLGRVEWELPGGLPWADDFDGFIRRAVTERDFARAVSYRQAGPSAALAVPTPDHYFPLLYALGAADAADAVSVFNDARTLGSLSMTSYLFS